MHTTSLTPPLTAPDFSIRKKNHQKISMVTCYDASFARIIAKTAVDCVLVGDSCAMVMHGESTTIPATVAMIALHTAAVRKGLPGKFIVADMPFLSYRTGVSAAVAAAGELVRSGAAAIKLEGLSGNEGAISRIVGSGIPVMGHLGLTPQCYHSLGGYRVQGKTPDAAKRLLEDARRLEELGAFSVVLECVPEAVGSEVAAALSIPVLGIGAGRFVDGQVLVLHDLLGLSGFLPTFARRYLDGEALVAGALDSYCRDVASGSFPSETEVFAS